MRGGSTAILIIIGLALNVGNASDADTDHKYIGLKKCKMCHQNELIGDQHAEWQKARHSKAYETLKGDKAARIAAEKGVKGPPHEAAECLQCHVTAYGADPSVFEKKPLKVSNGVQCESCHGPGSSYKKKTVMADRSASIANGMWEPGKNQSVCTTCHNEESPTWDPATGFDFEKSKKIIAHPIPADVKGRYDEALKERKAGRGE